jgi:geranylgeranyl diphosphate synthase type II
VIPANTKVRAGRPREAVPSARSAKRPPVEGALSILDRDGRVVVACFRQILKRYPKAPPRLLEAVEYSLMAGGKRLRPVLVLECASACGKKGGMPAAKNPSVLAAAVAIELIHTFSLVHDDLPAMDNDDLRRGLPTNHKVFGEAMAILAGDAMTTMAFEVIAAGAEPHLVPSLVCELAGASGPQGMIGGQVLDMDGENKSLLLKDLQRLHRLKTGALLTSACRLGAIAVGASCSALSAVTDFGAHLGLAFQIVDDILDVTSTPERLGKAVNKDQAKGKNTYPVLMGLEGSRLEAQRQLQKALAAIKPLGEATRALETLAGFVVQRQA